jgi:hypothetical protein
MSVAYTAAAVGAIGSAAISKKSSDKASRSQKKWRFAAIDEQKRQYDQTREDYAPWREGGADALGRLNRASTGDMSDFRVSPGYQFRLGEGQRAMDNRFSNRSGGGNAMRALVEYNQNFASNEFGNWWNRQAGLSGVGQAATQGTAIAGMNSANQIGSQYGQLGNNLGSINMWHGANMNNALQSGLSNMLYAKERKAT